MKIGDIIMILNVCTDNFFMFCKLCAGFLVHCNEYENLIIDCFQRAVTKQFVNCVMFNACFLENHKLIAYL